MVGVHVAPINKVPIVSPQQSDLIIAEFERAVDKFFDSRIHLPDEIDIRSFPVVILDRHDPHVAESRDLYAPAGRNLTTDQRKMSERLSGKPDAMTDNIVCSAGVHCKNAFVAGVSDPEGLFIERAVGKGILHAEFEGTGGYVVDFFKSDIQ